jgi:tetrapyrrole methylase family protein/MazG family protein
MAVVDGAVSLDDVDGVEGTGVGAEEMIAARLIAEAQAGDLVYVVPGSPLVLERSVELLREAAAAGELDLEVVASMSFLDLAWLRLGIDPVAAGVRLVDGRRLEGTLTVDGGPVLEGTLTVDGGPVLVAECHEMTGLADMLAAIRRRGSPVVVLKRLGLPDEEIFGPAWSDVDDDIGIDQLTSIYLPERTPSRAAEFGRFEDLVRILREECPWDREQTHASLRQHLLEETHETLEALDARAQLDDAQVDDELDSHLAEELGDLLYQIFFHARLGSERGAFSTADVVRGIHDKLVLRHPHVFGDVEADDSETVLSNWEAIKREEKGRASAMDGVPAALPALLLALKIQRRAAGTGFDWEGGLEIAYADVVDELDEVRADPSEHEVGDLLFAAVQVARRLDHDPEAALRGAVGRFELRFREVERLAERDGSAIDEASEEMLVVWWNQAKHDVG